MALTGTNPDPYSQGINSQPMLPGTMGGNPNNIGPGSNGMALPGPASNPLNDFWNQVNQKYAPELAANNAAANRDLYANIVKGGYLDQLRGFQNTDYQNSLAKLGLNQSNNAADIAALGANQGVYEQMRGINNLQKGFANEQLGNTQKFAAQSLANFLQQNALATRQNTQHQLSQGIAGGGGTTGGQTIGLSQIGTEGRNKAQAQEISTAERLAQALVQNKQALSEQDMANLRLDVNANENKARMTQLQNTAAEYGINAKDLYNQQQQGLAKLGLDQFMNANELNDMGSSHDATKRALYNQIMQEVIGAAPTLGAMPEQINAFRQAHPYGL